VNPEGLAGGSGTGERSRKKKRNYEKTWVYFNNIFISKKYEL
jgi:hypothetical protein